MTAGNGILVAGIGNIFQSDDGFGSEVARLLLADPVPDGVKIRQIYLLPDGTAFADLSSEMLHHRGGSLGELQTIYAIVDTLTANVPEIRLP